jgi:hypothetical protein
MHKILFFVVGFTLLSHVRVTDKTSNEGIISGLREIQTEINKVSASSPSMKALKKECVLFINDAILRVGKTNKVYPEAYINSLKPLISFSKTIDSSALTDQEEILRLLWIDLRIKFKEIPNTLGADLYTDLVSVKVITMKGTSQISNLRVRYSSLGYKIDYNRPEGSFQRLTSPVEEGMVPGYYKIWVTSDGNFTVLQQWSGEIDPQKNNVVQMDIQ